jgi:hypothetical protein
MAFIGNQPAESFTSFATQEFSTSATTSYTLDHAVTNENEIALFVNNVRQQPGSGKAYTATGTALTLSAATASTDTMYCVFLGRALQTVTPATNSITNAMITDNTIESGKLFSTFKNGITMADQFRLSADQSAATNAIITANLERVDTDGFGQLGTGMTVSSGVFSFPSTGIYLIMATAHILASASDGSANMSVETTVDNSTFTDALILSAGIAVSGGAYHSAAGSFIFDVTDTSTHKFHLKTHSMGSGSYLTGDTDRNRTHVTIIRLGDT